MEYIWPICGVFFISLAASSATLLTLASRIQCWCSLGKFVSSIGCWVNIVFFYCCCVEKAVSKRRVVVFCVCGSGSEGEDRTVCCNRRQDSNTIEGRVVHVYVYCINCTRPRLYRWHCYSHPFTCRSNAMIFVAALRVFFISNRNFW